MIKLVSFLSICAGLYELWGIYNMEARLQLIEDLKGFKGADYSSMPPEAQKKVIKVAVQALLILPGALLELSVLILGMLYFPSPLKWYVASILGLGIVSHYVGKLNMPNVYRIWRVADNMYCAAVLILGPLCFL
jgi:hypothetical protein